MKRLLLLLLICAAALFVSGSMLNAQETPAEEASAEYVPAGDYAAVSETKSKTEVFDLGQVVVKAEKKVNIENATTTTKITAVDIEAREEKSLKDTLQMVPGINVIQHAKGHTRFYMRGYDMDKVALLVDGIPVTDVYEANVDISKIPVQNASAIIINRGTCSALYGTTGTIGSINIVSSKPVELYTKASAEYGINGDYNLNIAHGMPIGDFFYWVTAGVDRQAPYDVSKKLDKDERLKWYSKFIRHDLYGDTIDFNNQTNDIYLNDTEDGEWPHQEMMKFNAAAKAGYRISDNMEAGLNTSYSLSKSERYAVATDGTSEYDPEAEEWSDPDDNRDNTLTSTAFTWPYVWNVMVAPYASYKAGAFKAKGNVYYNYTYEFLDGYQDVDETIPARGWGGTHSNWQNTTAGFNLFPEYDINEWNILKFSVLYRWDKHLEREKADGDFVGTGSGSADAAYELEGEDWFDTKLMTGKQVTVAVEDEIDLNSINIPAFFTVGISYDAQKLVTYEKRNARRQMGRVVEYGDTMEHQYIAEDDSAIWGTRDSFNPVVSAIAEPLKDILILRASFSQKTKLPTMSMYANVFDEESDIGIDPEKSINTNGGFELLFMDKAISFRADYFYSRFKDKLEEVLVEETGEKLYTNIEGVEIQGIEIISGNRFKNIADLMDMDVNLSYCFTQYKNLDDEQLDTEIYKGEKMEDKPEHQIIADIRLNFMTKTALNIWGQYSKGAIKYAMKSVPEIDDPHSIDVYKEVELHDPLLFNVKVSQVLMNNYEVYVMCKNIFDDYAADPFNPGPGRQFLFGAKAEF